jgi:hypothetical protein
MAEGLEADEDGGADVSRRVGASSLPGPLTFQFNLSYWDRGRLARLSAKRAQKVLLQPNLGLAPHDLGNPRS